MNGQQEKMEKGISRRGFGRLLAFGGTTALVGRTVLPGRGNPLQVLPPTPSILDESFWYSVRAQFVLDPDLAIMNAANLCPSPASVLETLYKNTRDIDQDPSYDNRRKMSEGREKTRRLLADYLGVTPEEIVITRNSSEGNNIVSSGLDLKGGDEVVIFSENHPSNHAAWREKAVRFGFEVRIVEQVNPHPGTEYYIKAFLNQMNSNTKVMAITHLTNTVGDLLPVKELCQEARERGILSMVDGAQTFGLMDLDLRDLGMDFYTGSGHKWPCGPKETGLLFINKRVHSKISPSTVSLYSGQVGISKTLEGFGQRDDAAIVALGEAVEFHNRIGKKAIENRSRELAQALVEGLKKMGGIKFWTNTSPERSVGVLTFRPGDLDVGKLSAALYEKHRIACTGRRGRDRGGIRLSPHFYNTQKEVEKILDALKHYMTHGV